MGTFLLPTYNAKRKREEEVKYDPLSQHAWREGGRAEIWGKPAFVRSFAGVNFAIIKSQAELGRISLLLFGIFTSEEALSFQGGKYLFYPLLDGRKRESQNGIKGWKRIPQHFDPEHVYHQGKI